MTSADQIKELRSLTGLSQVRFAATYGIPRRTLEDWERGISVPPDYVVDLLYFRVEAEMQQKNVRKLTNSPNGGKEK